MALRAGLNLIYGASNTGKSFAGKAIDFMLGGKVELPDIVQRRAYDEVLLTLTLPAAGRITLIRAIAGGAFKVANGQVDAASADARVISAIHDSKREDNLSQVLLKEIGLDHRKIAENAAGSLRALSFRDLMPFCWVDETSIQAERSPVENGNSVLKPAQRAVFKLLLTGHDDSAVVSVPKDKDFKAAKNGKLELLTELLGEIDAELTSNYPQSDQLPEQLAELEEAMAARESELDAARGSIRSLLDQKRSLATQIYEARSRLSDIAVNLGRFAQLGAVYASDIERLESLEEAGFLLLLGGNRDCPLCGATPESQRHSHGVSSIESSREAALAEVTKIRLQQRGLDATVGQLQSEQSELAATLADQNHALAQVEGDLERLAPEAEGIQRQFADVIQARDRVRRGIDLLERRKVLSGRQSAYEAMKRPAEPKAFLKPQSADTHEFAQVVAGVLKRWQFPGDLVTAFDDTTFDIKVDGKHRKDNGKGVRAILHAAFKVGLLIHCRQKQLPHPGFLVLDSPLVTYRDPVGSRGGELTADEEALSRTDLKHHFFEHLHEIRDWGQTIVLENVDPPQGIEQTANVLLFTGHQNQGRVGLL